MWLPIMANFMFAVVIWSGGYLFFFMIDIHID
jgi:hypothetical protein